MKISVAYDNHGKILAAFAMESSSPIRAHPEIENASVEDLEVPAEFHGRKLHEFLHHLHVDVVTRRLVKAK
jgi:hypothetical protein